MNRNYPLLLAVILLLSALCPAQRTGSIDLGQSSIALTGPWKFHPGDNPAYAQPGFDDSQWTDMDLSAQQGVHDPVNGAAAYTPGWTARGFPGYSGYAWYRRTLNLRNAGQDLWIELPRNIDDAVEVYANGQFVGQFGFAGGMPQAYSSQARQFRIPFPSQWPFTLAFRIWLSSDSLFYPEAGGMHSPPVLGLAPAVHALHAAYQDDRLRTYAASGLMLPVLLAAALVSFGLYLFNMREKASLWLGVASTGALARDLVLVFSVSTMALTWSASQHFIDLANAVQFAAWVLFWANWFHLSRTRSIGRIAVGLGVLNLAVATCLTSPVFGGLIPTRYAGLLQFLSVASRLPFAVLIFAVIYLGIRKNRTEGLLAALPLVLVSVALFQADLRSLHLELIFFPFGIQVTLGVISQLVSLLLIGGLLVRRYIQDQRHQQAIETEMQNAQQVQQVMVPQAIPNMPGFTFENQYLPAQQVGGDFFQTSPARTAACSLWSAT